MMPVIDSGALMNDRTRPMDRRRFLRNIVSSALALRGLATAADTPFAAGDVRPKVIPLAQLTVNGKTIQPGGRHHGAALFQSRGQRKFEVMAIMS
jgi:hypothetical protein